jgi:hypothetical protein
MCLLGRLPFVLFVLLVVSPSARAAAPIPDVAPTADLVIAADVQCKMIWGNQVCQEVGKKGGGKQKSSSKKSGANKAQPNKKNDGKTADSTKKGKNADSQAEVDLGPVQQKPTQAPPSNDNVLWGDYTYVPPAQK